MRLGSCSARLLVGLCLLVHLKLDEIVRAVEGARDDVRGVESRSEPEIRELTHEDDTVGAGSEGRR